MSPLHFLIAGPILSAGVLVTYVLRRRGVCVLGPHFYWDLVRLARRGRSTTVRVGYALLLLAGLFLLYAGQFRPRDPLTILFEPGPILSMNDLARFAESFVSTILTLQTAAVLVLTPAYVAGAIAEEKEAGTLDLLFTTHLSDREIVLGKLFARLVHLGGVLLAGLPILALTQFFGGVDMDIVLTGFAMAFLALLGTGSVSILVSTIADSVAGAVLGAYVIACVCAVPLSCLIFPASSMGVLPAVAVFVGFLSVMCLHLAITSLRNAQKVPQEVAGRLRTERLRTLDPPPAPISPPTSGTTVAPLKPITNYPLLWKEMNHPRPAPVISIVVLWLAILFEILMLSVAGHDRPALAIAFWSRVSLMMLSVITAVGVAFRSSGSLIRERHRNTLDSLLTLPVSGTEILAAKWLGSILRCRVPLTIGAGLLFLGVTVGFHPLGAVLFLVQFAVHLLFLASLGLWVSTVSRTPVRASFTMGLLLLVFFGSCLLDWVPEGSWSLGLSPLENWWVSTASWKDWTTSMRRSGKDWNRCWSELAFMARLPSSAAWTPGGVFADGNAYSGLFNGQIEIRLIERRLDGDRRESINDGTSGCQKEMACDGTSFHKMTAHPPRGLTHSRILEDAMDTISVAQARREEAIGKKVRLQGWVRTRRDSKGGFSFLELNDGSSQGNLQVVADGKLANYESEIKRLHTGCSVTVVGEVRKSPAKGQTTEVHAESVTVHGWADPETYPLQKKGHSYEFLRTIAHLRPRTNTFGAVARLRNCVSRSIHDFFQEQGFLYIHPPIITSSDCEGAGELFKVTAFNLGQVPRQDGAVDFTKDFFHRPTFLTVSGQLQAEIFACALGKVYTFGPTFRAENSNTSRHLAEFWMVEPEMAYYELEDNMSLAEAFFKRIVRDALNRCGEDLQFFKERVDKEVISRLEGVLNSQFLRVPYTEAIDILQKSGEKFEFPVSWGMDLQSEHERYLTEKKFNCPVILFDYPRTLKPFYMRVNDDGKTVRAMDVLVPGVGEIIGGSQREERLDVLEERMKEQKLDTSAYWWYLDLRRYGTVPHSGFGLGLERTLLFLSGMGNIRDVVPFPRTPGSADF